MTRHELAAWLAQNVRARRLQRAALGESGPGVPFEALAEPERRNWLDMADAVLELGSLNQPVDRLQDLARDWIRYTVQIADQDWRDEMRRTVVTEMRCELEKLAAQCRAEDPRR